MLIQIDGWYAGGKSILWSLLDGHKDIFVSPIHEYSFQAFLPYSNEDDWIKIKDIEFLRKILSKTGYYRLEEFSYKKEFDFLISSQNNIKIPFKMNFYEFDKEYIQNIQKLEKWDIETLCNLLYITYFKEYLKGINNVKVPKYFASMGHPISKSNYKKMKNILPKSKRILVKRDIKDIIATRCSRGITSLGKRIGTPFNEIIKTDEIFKILEYYEEFELLKKENKSQFFSIDFDELVYDTSNAMKRVVDFLEIEYSEILTKPTRDGKILEKNEESLIGKKNDSYTDLLTSNEIKKINYKINLYNKKKNDNKDIHLANKISNILIKFDQLKNEYNNIIIYGNGYLGNILATSLDNKLVAIVDKNKNKNTINISEINNYNYDIILISLIDREEDVILELLEYNIDISKVVTLTN